MIKRFKLYQRVILISVCIALLSLFLSLFSVGMHYLYLSKTYNALIYDEQSKILDEIEGLTIKDAIEKGYGRQIKILLEPRELNTSSVSKIENIDKIKNYAWLSGFLAVLVIGLLCFVYWYLRKRVIKTIKKDMDSIFIQTRNIVNSVDLKDKNVIIDIIPLIVEAIGYKSLAGWIRKALVTDEVGNTPQNPKNS